MSAAFTPLAVHETPTPDPNEVMVSGVDAQGIPKNVLLRDAPALRAALIATPRTLPNPAFAALEQQAFTAALEQFAANATPPATTDEPALS